MEKITQAREKIRTARLSLENERLDKYNVAKQKYDTRQAQRETAMRLSRGGSTPSSSFQGDEDADAFFPSSSGIGEMRKSGAEKTSTANARGRVVSFDNSSDADGFSITKAVAAALKAVEDIGSGPDGTRARTGSGADRIASETFRSALKTPSSVAAPSPGAISMQASRRIQKSGNDEGPNTLPHPRPAWVDNSNTGESGPLVQSETAMAAKLAAEEQRDEELHINYIDVDTNDLEECTDKKFSVSGTRTNIREPLLSASSSRPRARTSSANSVVRTSVSLLCPVMSLFLSALL